jgi:hypothetical protein
MYSQPSGGLYTQTRVHNLELSTCKFICLRKDICSGNFVVPPHLEI